MPWSFPLPPMQPLSRDLPPRWIPVGERTPDATDTVWVSCSEGVVMSDYLGQGKYGGFWSLGTMADSEGLNSERLQGVTHWKPIHQPAPPEVERWRRRRRLA
jgi:hypothetical protein